MDRRHNFQTVSWFYDAWTRGMLDLDPPYQRRSVWGQKFKDYFVDTVLQNYPAPALFLYEDIGADGRSVYHVVDGKQRLTTLFDFIRGQFPVSEALNSAQLGGRYFEAFSDAAKRSFWSYQFLVEYIPSVDEGVINGIFDRINRNVSKLTPQELRHAKLDGQFINTAESVCEWMMETLPRNFPRFAPQSRNQMKDVEYAALLLLLIEEGARSYSQDGLDRAFTDRDEAWEERVHVEGEFRRAIDSINNIISSSVAARDLVSTRLRNQADFYSLVGAVVELNRSASLAPPAEAARRLLEFTVNVEVEAVRAGDAALSAYFDAARSASNDKGPRDARIAYVRNLLTA